ncbi:glycoside hydrolase family 88 protein [Opitutales bacterium ASA1]|uniref:glucuronyl hydrolase n=1 Tax=Congregicoccus parvus TaxID=3081749 RepID=UPI002B2A06BF|nr:glycoside hydrolase family 88 protein [Opitutales bacterium ASA1]
MNLRSLLRSFILSVLGAGGVAELPAAAAEEASALAREQFAFAREQYAHLLEASAVSTDRLPRSIDRGRFKLVEAEDWTSGFFPGALWLIYEHTGDPAMLAAAEDFTRRVERIQFFDGHHDLGFMLGCSYGEGLRITGRPEYREVLVQGARTLATRFRPEVGLIRSWDFGKWSFPVIIDNMMNLDLLWFAYGETGDTRLRDIALAHADKTLANHFRPDGSSFHLVDYDPNDGTVVGKQTVQGAADDSAWARGQAWGLSGFTTMARLTGRADYLAKAVAIAEFIANHPRLPEDAVPYWDFDAPGIPDVPRDASAGAIMACAFLELAELVDDTASIERYVSIADRQIRSLAGPDYRARLGENGGFLLMHSVGHIPEKHEIDVPLIYADYYFLKALSMRAEPVVRRP